MTETKSNEKPILTEALLSNLSFCMEQFPGSIWGTNMVHSHSTFNGFSGGAISDKSARLLEYLLNDNIYLNKTEDSNEYLDKLCLVNPYPHVKYNISKEIIPYIKQTKRTIQLVSRINNGSFGAEISNRVELGDLLEKVVSALNKILAKLKPFYKRDKQHSTIYYLSNPLKSPIFIKICDTIQKSQVKVPYTQNIFYNTKLNQEETNILALDDEVLDRNEIVYSDNNKTFSSYSKIMLLALLDNINVYLTIYITLYLNYFIGYSCLYNKNKDRQHKNLIERHYIPGLIRSNLILDNYEQCKVSSIVKLLGLLNTSLPNVTSTAFNTISKLKFLTVKSTLNSEQKNDILNCFNTIASIFQEFSELDTYLYKIFFMGSPLETIITQKVIVDKNFALDEIATEVLKLFYTKKNKKVADVILQKIPNILASSYYVISLHDVSIPPEILKQKSITNTELYTVIGQYFISHYYRSIKPDTWKVLNYWFSKEYHHIPLIPKDMIESLLIVPTRVIHEGNTALLLKSRQLNTTHILNFLQNKTTLSPFDFNVLSSFYFFQGFLVVPPGDLDFNALGTRKVTLGEKVAMALLLYGVSLADVRADNSGIGKAIPEFGIHVR